MKQELIVKSNILLQQPLYKTSIELKIFSMVLLKIRDNPDSEIFTLNIRELMNHFDGSKENYTYLKNVAKKMFGVIDLNPSETTFDLNVVFVRINTKEESQITFEVNKKIKPYILNLTHNFTKYYFENIARMKSSFSIRVYELLKQYENIGSRSIDLIKLRHFLNIGDGKYLKYSNFKNKVLLVAQKELKEKTDLYFEFEEIKTGRKITDINFIIFKNVKVLKENGKIEPEQLNLSEEQQQLKAKLIEFGIAEKVVNELIFDVSTKQIEQNIIYTQKEYDTGKVKNNFAGFLLKAIKNNYAGNISLFEEDEKKKKAEEQKKLQLDKKRTELTGELSRKFAKQERENFVASLTENQQQSLIDEILVEVELDDFAVNHIKKKGLVSPSAYLGILSRIEGFAEKKQEYIAKGLKEAGL